MPNTNNSNNSNNAAIISSTVAPLQRDSALQHSTLSINLASPSNQSQALVAANGLHRADDDEDARENEHGEQEDDVDAPDDGGGGAEAQQNDNAETEEQPELTEAELRAEAEAEAQAQAQEQQDYYSDDDDLGDEDGEYSSSDSSPRENRILTFADEHGKHLCEFNFYQIPDITDTGDDSDEDEKGTRKRNAGQQRTNKQISDRKKQGQGGQPSSCTGACSIM